MAPPPPVVAPPPAVTPPQTAALAPPPVAQRRGEVRVAFPAGGSELPNAARGELDQMARRLAGDEALRLQLNAYASETGDQSSQARRLSLSRALAVRAYLIDKGVRSTRLDVRAIGKTQDDGPADRVDLVVVGR
ncbi:OmpA family protein [Stella humosa]|uniref:OmpA family protein n=1 Tax=Stella humosa TaxID=94 RepID=A0A3N1LIV8_9PROT|nr:OmpA family protein [Stella humosa]